MKKIMKDWSSDTDRVRQVFSDKDPLPLSPPSPPQILHGYGWAGTRTFEVKGRQHID